jgi:hypothetical protein
LGFYICGDAVISSHCDFKQKAMRMSEFDRRRWGWTATRFALGAVLVSASALKGYQISTTLYLDQEWIRSYIIVLIAAQLEMILGAYLVLLDGGRTAWTIAFILWAIFVTMATREASKHELSCGCFGLLQIPPLATAIFDAIVLALLLVIRPASTSVRARQPHPWRAVLFIAWIIATLVAGLWIQLRQSSAIETS